MKVVRGWPALMLLLFVKNPILVKPGGTGLASQHSEADTLQIESQLGLPRKV